MSDWKTWTPAAFRGVSLGVDEWRLDAELADVRIIGPLALGAPGCVRNQTSFAATVRASLTRAGAPSAVADAVASAVWSAWKEWADGISVPGLPWYPSFAAWPVAVAPPTANVPTPVALCVSAGVSAMSAKRLSAAVKDTLDRRVLTSSMRSGIDALAEDLQTAFGAWTATAMVAMVFGSGSAPVAPPYVPVAPVVGTVVRSRGFLAAAAPFPQVPPSAIA